MPADLPMSVATVRASRCLLFLRSLLQEIPVSETRPRRDALLTVRADPADLARWTAAAGGRGGMSQWTREILNQAAAVGSSGTEVAQELQGIRRELAAWGNNWNQIAKALNAGEPAGDLAAIRQRLDEMANQVTRKIRVIRPPRRPAR